jgi:uncharacterized protein YjbI with pentapeptide repeats
VTRLSGSARRPPSLEASLEPVSLLLDDEQRLEDGCIGNDVAPPVLTDLEVLGCRFEDTRFTGSTLERPRISDAVFTRCDLSGTTFRAARLERVLFEGCRMGGVGLAQAELTDVRFAESKLTEANLRMARLVRVHFEDCDLRTADLYDTTLDQTRFLACDLRGLDLWKASISDIWLHGSRVDELHNAEALRGARIDPSQIVPLALAMFDSLGISVDDEPPAP